LGTVFQTVGGAFFVSAAQSAFVNKIISVAATTAPTVNPLMIIATGATQIRNVFTDEQIPGILVAYMAGIKVAFAIALAGVGTAFAISLFSSWGRLNRDALKNTGAA
jgi:hypothetical protein